MKSIFITFQIKFVVPKKVTIKYAIKTNKKKYRKILADISSLEGYSYIRINSCGIFKKDVHVISDKNYLAEMKSIENNIKFSY